MKRKGRYKMFKKKVLILSLGTGKPNITIDNIEALEQTSQSDRSPYTITNYRFNEDTEDVEKAAFLAIPLIKKFEPEEVVILGTVQSAWAELAYMITTGIFGKNTYSRSRDEFEKLVSMRPKSGKDTEDQVRYELERIINRLFEKTISVSSATDIKRITAICTKYGISKEELDTNYNELREHFEKIFNDKDTEYKVGFDITHSFRSLPIFNLVLLNYFRNIKDIEIDISNIYYGCFEANRECGYAPVVDLNELIYSMDLTTGVKEFLDTGNTVSLIDAINKNEENENEKNIITKELRNINDSFQFN